MERLTFQSYEAGGWDVKEENIPKSFDALASYENTGSTPDEVTQTQKENADLKELLRLAVYELNTMNMYESNWTWQHADRAREVGVEV